MLEELIKGYKLIRKIRKENLTNLTYEEKKSIKKITRRTNFTLGLVVGTIPYLIPLGYVIRGVSSATAIAITKEKKFQEKELKNKIIKKEYLRDIILYNASYFTGAVTSYSITHPEKIINITENIFDYFFK